MRKTRTIDWAVCSGFFLLGCFFLASEIFAHYYGTTPEAELTVVQGAASEYSSSSFEGGRFLHFTVQGQAVEYSSDLPGYDKVLAAVQDGVPMTLGVSTKRETIFPRQGWVPLYTLSIGDETLLTYEHTVTKGYRGSHMTWLIPAFLLLLSGWGFWNCFRRRDAVPMTAEQLATAWRSPKRIRTASILFSTVLYTAGMMATLHPDSQKVLGKALGDTPLGIPLPFFLVLLITLLFLPFPFAAWHLYSVIFRELAARAMPFEGGDSTSLLADNSDSFHRKRSLMIVMCTAAFYIALMVAWIVYAESHGL